MPDVELEFEWDERKARANLRKHGVSFQRAAAIFRHPRLEHIDDRVEYGEIRWIALGRSESGIYKVVYTWREQHVVRIISAQKANRNEQQIYYRAIPA
jgi:hypothetical protein